MRLEGLLGSSDETRSEIDGFVCDFDAPWNAGHRLIERYGAEVIPTGPKWDSDYSLRKFGTDPLLTRPVRRAYARPTSLGDPIGTARGVVMLPPVPAEANFQRSMPHTAPSQIIDRELLRITRALVERLRPLRIALFGSRARGDARADSDYDLMVEVEEERRTEVDNLAADVRRDLRIGADIFVTTPARFAEQRDDVGHLAWQVDHDGRLLWARDEVAAGQPLRGTHVRERRRGRPKSVAMWVRRAENDFLTMGRALDAGSPIPDAAAFHAHQSAEKYLRAAIVWSWRPPPRTHDLEVLLRECPPAVRADDDMRQACEDLTKLLARARYPHELEPTESEARSAADWAAMVRRAARTAMGLT